METKANESSINMIAKHKLVRVAFWKGPLSSVEAEIEFLSSPRLSQNKGKESKHAFPFTGWQIPPLLSRIVTR